MPLGNPWVPESPTMKIETAKISKTQLLASFMKICTHENYQPYGIPLLTVSFADPNLASWAMNLII